MDIRITERGCALVVCGWLALVAGCGDNAGTPPPGDGNMAGDPTLVQTQSGPVQGTIVDGSRQFLGIPYAKPPVGDLRWKAPQKPAPWTDVLPATEFGKRCAQLVSTTFQNAASNDEDCLSLNVWTPSPLPTTPVAVMVWIHGGANVNGSTAEPVPFVNSGVFYSGQILAAEHNVIVVSMNYRLGLFGFFEHPDLVAEGSSGNQGLLDQRLAMQWVHDNIAQFGGDPGNVTIFGESSGSFNVCMHVASPGSAGLFHRAISESGGCTTLQRTKPQAVAAGTTFATAAGCTGAGALACLRGKATAELMALPAVAAGTGFGADVDTQLMPDQPRTLYDAGQVAHVPYLLGSNTDEGTLFLGNIHITEDQEYVDALDQLFGKQVSKDVVLHYPLTDFTGAMPNAAEAALARVIGDSRLVCPTFDTAARMAHNGAPVFLYNYDIPVPIAVPGVYLGVSHGSELPSVFGTSPAFTNDTKAVSELMQRYWAGFARTGDPNQTLDPQWPAFTEAANVRMNFSTQPATVTDFRAAQCAFWRASYANQFP